MANAGTVRIDARPGAFLVRLAIGIPVITLIGLVLLVLELPMLWTGLGVSYVVLILVGLVRMIASIRAIRRGHYYLELNAIGFVERRLEHVREAKWGDCSQFDIWAQPFLTAIVFNNGVMPKRSLSWLGRDMTGRNQSVSCVYKLDAVALCELLNEYRDRAVQGSRLPDRQPSNGEIEIVETGAGQNRFQLAITVALALGFAGYMGYEFRGELRAYFTSGRPLVEILPEIALYGGGAVLALGVAWLIYFGMKKLIDAVFSIAGAAFRAMFRRPPP